ncbi:tRNA pseudouridine(55) synthase TruB, partial [Chloroflexota bacterium]
SLVRLRYGLFDIRDAVLVSQLEDAFRYGYWQDYVYPIDSVFSHWTAVVVSDDAAKDIRNGRPLILDDSYSSEESSPENRCRAYDHDGRFLGVLRFDAEKGQWRPQKVFI